MVEVLGGMGRLSEVWRGCWGSKEAGGGVTGWWGSREAGGGVGRLVVVWGALWGNEEAGGEVGKPVEV